MARILFVSTSTTVGGAEKTLHTLATEISPQCCEVAGVVSLKPEGEYARRLKARGLRVESLDIERAPRLSDARRLAKIIARERPDIVHSFMYQAIQLCRLAKNKTSHRFKLITSPRVHYRTRSLWTLLIDRALKNRDDLLIAECESSRDFLIRRLGYSPDKVRTIRNGVSPVAWPISEAAREAKRLDLKLSPDDILVGAVGRLDKQKGFDVLIKAMAQLKKNNLRCVILGDGPQRTDLETLIRKNGLEESVRLPGERGDIASWYPAFDIYCLPSLWEGLPNTLLEAMALGLPVVASAVDGVPEAVEDGATGLLVAPSDPAALAAALNDLAASPARRASLGAAARASMTKNFTLRRMIEEYQNSYSTILASPRGAFPY